MPVFSPSTSADRLWRGWGAAQRARRAGIAGSAGAESRVEALLAPLARDARIVTVIDGHPATLGWLGSVRGHRVEPLGVDRFGQSGSLPDLYREHGIGMDAIPKLAVPVPADGRGIGWGR